MKGESTDIQAILNRIAEIVQQEMDSEFRLVLFGSRAKGHSAPSADIDIGMMEARNRLAHTYNEQQAIRTYRDLPRFLESFQKLVKQIP